MKKSKIILITVLLSLSFISCKKKYMCTCLPPNSVSYHIVEARSVDKGEEECKTLCNTAGYDYSWNY